MKTSKLLTLAQRYLCTPQGVEVPRTGINNADYRTQFLCLAISHASIAHRSSMRPLNAALGTIRRRIAPEYTVLDWLHQNKHITQRKFNKMNVPENKIFPELQRYRHAWLEHLINEFKDKGD
tara:strand:- start:243 stop:608 length:366 start_codon:yes stop_codon:yes gene_type:complete